MKGFTLIELLVSIAIIFLLLGVTFAGYARFTQRQNLLNAGQTMKNVLRDAQARAFTGEQDCSICDCTPTANTTLLGWYADLSTGPPPFSRSLYGQCNEDTFPPTPIPFPISADIIITPYLTPAATYRILFRPYPPGTDQSGTICLSDPKLEGNYYSITVDYSGNISDSKDLIPSCP